MEDLFIDEEVTEIDNIKFDDSQIPIALKELSIVIKDRLHSNFRFLCAVRAVIKGSSHGNLILSGSTGLVRYSWVSREYTLLDILQKMFGFSEKYIEYLVKIINKFLRIKTAEDVLLGLDALLKDTDSTCIKGIEYVFDFFEYLSISKMQELLPLSNEQIQKAFDSKVITVKSTVKEIRDYVKSIKGTKPDNKVYEDNDEELTEDIEQCFDPSKYYEASYFESQSKNTLINYCLQYQNKYVKRK